jgi:hypothetical protein
LVVTALLLHGTKCNEKSKKQIREGDACHRQLLNRRCQKIQKIQKRLFLHTVAQEPRQASGRTPQLFQTRLSPQRIYTLTTALQAMAYTQVFGDSATVEGTGVPRGRRGTAHPFRINYLLRATQHVRLYLSTRITSN